MITATPERYVPTYRVGAVAEQLARRHVEQALGSYSQPNWWYWGAVAAGATAGGVIGFGHKGTATWAIVGASIGGAAAMAGLSTYYYLLG